MPSSSRPFLRGQAVARFVSRFEETAEDIGDWKGQLLLNQAARFRWIAAPVWLVLGGLFLGEADGKETVLLGLMIWLPYILPLAPWAPLRFLQRFLMYLIPILLVLLELLFAVSSVLEVFDRLSNERMAQTPILRSYPLSDAASLRIAVAVLAGCAAVAVVLALRRKHPVPRVRMASGVLKISLTVLTLFVPMNYVMTNHNSGVFLSDLSASFFGLVAGLFAVLWAIGALIVLVHARDVQCPAVCVTETGAAEYLKSASGVAATALLIAFFGLNTCLSYTRSLDRFISTRDAFAMDLIATVVGTNKALHHAFDVRPDEFVVDDQGRQEFALVAKIGHDSAALQKAYPKDTVLNPTPPLPWLEQARVLSVESSEPGFLDTTPAGTAFEVEVTELDLPQPWRARPVLQFPSDLRTTHDLKWAAPCSEKLDEVSTYDKLYRSCEKQVVGRGVKFPVVDTEVPIEYVVAATFLALTGCIVILTDRIQQILDAPTATKLEPWIMLDAGTRSAKAIANAWMLGLAASPWLLMGFAVAICALQVRVAGSTTTVTHDALIAAPLLAGVCVAPMLSLSLLRQIITVRYVRKCRWLTPADGAADEAPRIAD